MTDHQEQDLTAIWEKAIRQRINDELVKADSQVVPLPSGLSVKAVRVNIVTLVEAGRIPDALTPFVTELMALGDEGDADTISEEIDRRWEEWLMVLDAVWLAAVAEPVFTKKNAHGPGEIPIGVVDISDKMALYNWCQGVTNYLAPFQLAKSEDVSAGSDGAPRPVVDKPVDAGVHGGGTRPRAGHPSDQPVDSVPVQPGDDVLGPVRRRPAGSKGRTNGGAKAQPETDHSRTEVHVS